MVKRKKPTPQVEFNPRTESHGYKHVRWVENASRGLRLVGFCDEIASREGRPRMIDHRGWFTDDDNYGEVYRGVVYQLPTRGGQPWYVYGYADPDNDGCALLCFDRETDLLEAARAADRFAEIYAEHERDYRRAWSAGRRYDDLDGEIKEMRADALAIGAEMRAVRGQGVKDAPRSCAALRDRIISLYRQIQGARKERASLLNDYGHCSGFKE